MFEAYSNDVLWIVVIGFLVAFFLAFGVGANDVANSFGTSVGSKVLTLTQACILATIFEILGALLMGFKVSDTIRKDIYDLDMYENEEKVLMMGNMAALFGSATWNIIATLLRLPISGTHSIVGAVLGFTLVVKGFRGIQWKTLGFIVSSWFLSPVLSGVVSVIIFLLIRKFILSKDNPSQVGVAFIYIISVFINVLSIVLDGSPVLYLDRLPPWLAVVISAAVGIIVGVIIQFLIVGNKKKQVPIEQAHEEISLENPISKDENLMLTDDDHPEVRKLFKGLQIMTAIFGSFAHGGNDVSNAIAPLISLWLLYTKDTNGSTPAWLLIYGGFGISIGLWVMGRKVIQTMGQDLTKITPLSGFTIEIGATTTVLLASKIGIPISTTHCKVGSIVFVGMTRSTNDVDFKLFKNIILAWLVTLPFTGVISGLTMLVLYSTTIS